MIYNLLNDVILEISDACENCILRAGSCTENECVLFRIESKIVDYTEGNDEISNT